MPVTSVSSGARASQGIAELALSGAVGCLAGPVAVAITAPWQREFLAGLASSTGDAALSVARGNGKTALIAAIAVAAMEQAGI